VRVLIVAGALGFGWLISQVFSIGIRWVTFARLEALFGDLGDRPFGLGYAAMICATAILILLTQGIAVRWGIPRSWWV